MESLNPIDFYDIRSLLSGSGITTEYCPMRHMLNLESANTYEGTEIIHQLVFGQEIAGFEAF